MALDQIPGPQSNKHSDSLFDEFWKSAVASAVEQPVTALGQIFDQNFQWEPVKPGATKTGSLDYYVEGIGGAVGLVADISVLKHGFGKLAGANLAASLDASSV